MAWFVIVTFARQSNEQYGVWSRPWNVHDDRVRRFGVFCESVWLIAAPSTRLGAA